MDLEMFEDIRERLNLSNLSKPALIGVVAILVMVAVTAGRLLIGTATANEFSISREPAQTEEGAAGAQEQSDGVGAAGHKAASASIFVHVSGEVRNPGLCEVEEGARVAEAITAAGGFTEAASPESVNLARPIVDGEQIVVASKEDRAAQVEAAKAKAQAGTAAPAAGGAAAATGLVNINTADATELKTLSGVGDVTAQKIIDYRESNGPFQAKEDLKKVSGIGDKTFEKLADKICI